MDLWSVRQKANNLQDGPEVHPTKNIKHKNTSTNDSTIYI
jgi:hypothetical protein